MDTEVPLISNLADLADFPHQNPFPVFSIDTNGILKYANKASVPVLSLWNCGIGQSIPESWREKFIKSLNLSNNSLEIFCGERIYSLAAVTSAKTGDINVYGSEISSRLHFEKALEESEEKYRSIVETSMEGIWVVNPDGMIIYANRRIADMLGIRQEELIGREVLELFDPETRKFLKCGNPERRSTGIREKQISRADGRYIWVLEAQSPLLDSAGVRVGMLSMLTDISSQKEDQKLKERLHQLNLRMLIRSSQTDILDGMLSDACQALGVEEGAVFVEEGECWKPWYSHGISDEKKQISFNHHDFPFADQAAHEKTAIIIECGPDSPYAKNGSLIAYDVQSALVVPILIKGLPPSVLFFIATHANHVFSKNQLDFGNKLAVSISFFLENNRLFHELENQLSEKQVITQELAVAQQNLEQLLNDKEQRLKETEANLTDEESQRINAEIALLKRQQALEAVYEMAVSFESGITGLFEKIAFQAAEILKVPFVGVHDVRDGKIEHCALVSEGRLINENSPAHPCAACKITYQEKQIIQFQGDLNTYFEGRSCFGSHVCRSFIGVPIRDEHSNLLGAICVFDHKNRVFTQEETHLLEIFSRYSCHEILQNRLEKQLNQAQEMKILGQLTSGVAHEVRNPLNGIMAIMEALGQELGEKLEYGPYLMHMRKQVTRLSSLMEDLLELGRTIKKKNMQPLKLKPFLDETVVTWRESARQKSQIILETDEADPAWTANLDPFKMVQVITNLLENAAQHSPKDKPIIIRLEDGGYGWAKVSIIDRGNGIPEKNLQRVFEPFFTTRRGGTGLGLCIVKRIIESHEGRIEMHNNSPEPGVTVQIHMPLSATA